MSYLLDACVFLMLTGLLMIHHCSSVMLKTIILTKVYEQKAQSYNFQETNY